MMLSIPCVVLISLSIRPPTSLYIITDLRMFEIGTTNLYADIIFSQASVAMVAFLIGPVIVTPLEASIRMTSAQVMASFTSVLLTWPSTPLWKCCKTSDWPRATETFFGTWTFLVHYIWFWALL